MSYIKDKIEYKVQEGELKVQESLAEFPRLYRLFIIFAVIAVIPGYFLVKTAVKTYWSNQYEESLIYAKVSFANPERPSVRKVFLTTQGNNTYSAALEVVNENVDLSLSLTPVTAVFYNAKGDIMFKENTEMFLLPAEGKYLIVPKVVTGGKPEKVVLEFPENLNWQKKLTIPQVTIMAPAPSRFNQSDPLAYVVEGNFTNSSHYLLKKVTIKILLYDEQGAIIAASARDEFDVRPNERRAYRVSWPGVYATNVNFIDVLPEVNVLDKNNLSVPASDSPASGLDRPTENDN
jgi:hypothetical protein